MLGHPSNSSYKGFTFERSRISAGNSSIRSSANVYAVHTLIVFRLSRTSSFVTAIPVSPFTRAASRSITRSSHPTRRGRCVVVPYSPPPRSLRMSAVLSWISVGSGPVPTRLVNAFTTPITSVIACGPTPDPIEAIAAPQFELTPYG